MFLESVIRAMSVGLMKDLEAVEKYEVKASSCDETFELRLFFCTFRQ